MCSSDLEETLVDPFPRQGDPHRQKTTGEPLGEGDQVGLDGRLLKGKQTARAAKAGGMTPEESETMLTVLIAGQRANAVPNGWERLQGANPAAAKAEYQGYVNRMNANPEVKAAMESAMREYKKYNEGLLEFAAQCGYLSKDEVRRLNKQPYVPFYRVEDGNVKLFVLGERPITIGNLKDSPDLAQFLGDEKKIQPILTRDRKSTRLNSSH